MTLILTSFFFNFFYLSFSVYIFLQRKHTKCLVRRKEATDVRDLLGKLCVSMCLVRQHKKLIGQRKQKKKFNVLSHGSCRKLIICEFFCSLFFFVVTCLSQKKKIVVNRCRSKFLRPIQLTQTEKRIIKPHKYHFCLFQVNSSVCVCVRVCVHG